MSKARELASFGDDISDGVISAARLPASIPSGTKMLFQQTSAPTGWTKDTTHNDKALRVVSGTAGSGGSFAFSSAFVNRTVSSTTAGGTVGNTTLTISQVPSHQHNTTVQGNVGTARSYQSQSGRYTYSTADGGYEGYYSRGTTTYNSANGSLSNFQGGSGAHNHSFTGSSHNHTLDISVQYVDLIIATKD